MISQEIKYKPTINIKKNKKKRQVHKEFYTRLSLPLILGPVIGLPTKFTLPFNKRYKYFLFSLLTLIQKLIPKLHTTQVLFSTKPLLALNKLVDLLKVRCAQTKLLSYKQISNLSVLSFYSHDIQGVLISFYNLENLQKKKLKGKKKYAIQNHICDRYFNSSKLMVFIGFLSKCPLSLNGLKLRLILGLKKVCISALNASLFHSYKPLCLSSLSHTLVVVKSL